MERIEIIVYSVETIGNPRNVHGNFGKGRRKNICIVPMDPWTAARAYNVYANEGTVWISILKEGLIEKVPKWLYTHYRVQLFAIIMR